MQTHSDPHWGGCNQALWSSKGCIRISYRNIQDMFSMFMLLSNMFYVWIYCNCVTETVSFYFCSAYTRTLVEKIVNIGCSFFWLCYRCTSNKSCDHITFHCISYVIKSCAFFFNVLLLCCLSHSRMLHKTQKCMKYPFTANPSMIASPMFFFYINLYKSKLVKLKANVITVRPSDTIHYLESVKRNES